MYHQTDVIALNNVMDQWILASTQSLVQFVIGEMKGTASGLVERRGRVGSELWHADQS